MNIGTRPVLILVGPVPWHRKVRIVDAAARLRYIYEMPLAEIYPHYITKAEKKGKTKRDVDKLIDEFGRGKKMESILRTP